MSATTGEMTDSLTGRIVALSHLVQLTATLDLRTEDAAVLLGWDVVSHSLAERSQGSIEAVLAFVSEYGLSL